MVKQVKKKVAFMVVKSDPKSLLFASCDKKFLSLSFDENYLPELTVANARLCETLLQHDRQYNSTKSKRLFDQAKKPTGFVANISETGWKDIVQEIAKINHTRTPEPIQDEIASLLVEPGYNDRLLIGDPSLVQDLITILKKRKSRGDISLLSKVCKWVYYWQISTQAGFSIYDSVVKGALLYYAKRFKVNTKGRKMGNYCDYHATIIEICNATGLTPHEFDRIVWYFFRDNPVQSALAATLGKK